MPNLTGHDLCDTVASDLRLPLVDLAKQAGSAILNIYQQDFAVVDKTDNSPLTEADLAANDVILAGLSSMTPNVPVLSEESSEVAAAVRHRWQTYWLVDPLDGTREFVKRNGEFTVNIALIENGQPVLGVVYAPVLARCYSGIAGIGAWRQDGDTAEQAIKVRVPAHPPFRVVGSRSHAGDSLSTLLAKLGSAQIISMGSSLKLCLVAEGAADLYPRLGPTSEWDTAAAQAVVEAAGGRVTDTDGQVLRYNAKESLLNPHFLVLGDATIDWLGYLD